MCIPGSGFGRNLEAFLLFSIIKDKSETGKESYLLPFYASHVGTHPFGLRHFLNQGSVAAWSQGLIFQGGYLPSYSSASAG